MCNDKIKDLKNIEQVSGGMCNCIGCDGHCEVFQNGACVLCGNMGKGEIKFFGIVSYANVCKDLLMNVTGSDKSIIGCFPQDDV